MRRGVLTRLRFIQQQSFFVVQQSKTRLYLEPLVFERAPNNRDW